MFAYREEYPVKHATPPVGEAAHYPDSCPALRGLLRKADTQLQRFAHICLERHIGVRVNVTQPKELWRTPSDRQYAGILRTRRGLTVPRPAGINGSVRVSVEPYGTSLPHF